MSDAVVTLFVGFFCGGAISFGITADGVEGYYQTECVKRGAAVWQVSDDGETTFKWVLEPKTEQGEKE